MTRRYSLFFFLYFYIEIILANPINTGFTISNIQKFLQNKLYRLSILDIVILI